MRASFAIVKTPWWSVVASRPGVLVGECSSGSARPARMQPKLRSAGRCQAPRRERNVAETQDRARPCRAYVETNWKPRLNAGRTHARLPRMSPLETLVGNMTLAERARFAGTRVEKLVAAALGNGAGLRPPREQRRRLRRQRRER